MLHEVRVEILKVETIPYTNKKTGKAEVFSKVTTITHDNEIVVSAVGRDIEIKELESASRMEGTAVYDITSDGAARINLISFVQG